MEDPHGNQPAIQDCKVEARIETVSNRDVASIIQVEWRFQIWVFPKFSDDLLERILTVSEESLCRVVWSGRKVSVKVMTPLSRSVSGVRKVRREGIVAGIFGQNTFSVSNSDADSRSTYSIPLIIRSYCSHHGTWLSCLAAAS